MRRSPVDLTDLALAARSNDPRVVTAFGQRFADARLHLPLAVLEGVRNRPETAIELGARLPIHWLNLDNDKKAVPIFTTLGHCHDCAERLDWETDGQSIKALALPGDVALGYLAQVVRTRGVERTVLNPLSEAELHLARTEIENLAAREPIRSLWFYSRNGKLKRPVRILGTSLLETLFSKADRAIDSWAHAATHRFSVSEASDALDQLEARGPLGALASELYRIVTAARVGRLDVTVTKSGGTVDIEAKPDPGPALLARLKAAAEDALANGSEDARLSFRIDDASVVLSSSTTLDAPSAPRPSPSPAKPPRYDYIPLEPEETSD